MESCWIDVTQELFALTQSSIYHKEDLGFLEVAKDPSVDLE